MVGHDKENNNVKNWFLIQKVKFEKFIKEHKYISVFLGVFLVSSVIALIVFASDEDPYAGNVVAQRNGDITISSTADPDTEINKEVQSFSTVIYEIPFKLTSSLADSSDTSTRIVDVVASIDSNIDAALTMLDDNVKSSLKVENGKQTLTVNDYVSLNNSQSISIYLKVYNIKNGTTISPDITICDSTSKESDKCFTLSGDDTKIIVKSSEISLVPKTVPGLPYDYLDGSGQTKRYIPFGVLVGLNKSDINEDGTLTGLYINTDITLSLSAVSSTNNQNGYMDQVNIEDFYGLYAGKTKGNAKMDFLASSPFPYHSLSAAPDSSVPSVYNSGNIEYKKCEVSDTTCNLYDTSNGANQNVYSLKISGIKTDGRYVTYNSTGTADIFSDVFDRYKDVIDLLNKFFGGSSAESVSTVDYLALGAYYVTAATEPLDFSSDEEQYRGFKLNVKYQTENSVKDGISYWGFDTKDTNSTKQMEVSFQNDKGENLADSYELAYGDEVIIKIKSNYEYINVDESSSHQYSLVGKVPVAAMSYDEGLSPFEMIEYSSDISENPYFLQINGTDENLQNYDIKVTYVACESLSDCDIKTDTTDLVYSSYEDYKTAKSEAETNGSSLYLSYVKYEVNNLPNNAEVDFRLRLNVGTDGYGKIIANATNQFSYEGYGEMLSSTTDAKDEIVVTPYKARTTINIDNNGNDVSINLSNKTSSTLAIYPKISLPANLINTNTVLVNDIESLTIVVNLPDKINYLPNSSYISPELIEEDGKKLTYTLKNQKINSWIDPIYMDVNYDIDVSSEQDYLITVVVEAKTTRNDNGHTISDISDIQNRTSVAKIRFLNTGILSYSMSTSNASILKEEDFDIITKIYNRSTQAQNNMEIITVLPYNDQNNSSYHGTYSLDITGTNSMLCTTSPSSILGDSDNLINEGAIIWEDCSKYSDINYSGVTAIKTVGIQLQTNQSYEQRFNIVPTGNGASDYYKVEAYIKTSDNKIKKINPVTVYVETIKISGVVWEDFNDDGLISKDESRIPDVGLKLYDSQTDELIQTVYSDKTGSYTFDQIYTEESTVSNSYYIVANYNTAKYSLTHYKIGDDKSINSSFCLTDSDVCLVTDSGSGEEISDEVSDDDFDDDYEDLEEIENEEVSKKVKTEIITISDGIRTVGNINLGLTPKKQFNIKLNKYITSSTVTNALGINDEKSFGNVSLAKLDVKDIGNVSIKVTYTIEIENSGYYPGYVYKIKDIIPDGMEFNSSYAENSGWSVSESGYLENTSLSGKALNSGEKKYITLSLDLTRKEAGTFINYVMVDDSDLEIYNGTASELKSGGMTNE